VGVDQCGVLGRDTKGIKHVGVNECCGLGRDAKGEWGVDVEGEDPADQCGGSGLNSKVLKYTCGVGCAM
jgi:hypothetical protein